MSGLSRRCGGVGREDGSAIILTAIAMTALLAFLTFGLDVGNWFLHKRHLQMQADAAALATGQEFSAACGSATQNDQRIIDRAKQYAGFASPSGPSYNPQVAGRQDSVHIAINSSTWYGQSKTDPTVDTRPPCQSAMVDVKLTETDLPFLIKLINGVVPGNVVPAINAHARISVRKLTARSGFLPFAVPQASPSRVRATFINETTGATLGQA
ncbi:pilus assembly protein TadG-related protein, partial [Paraconexibacter sp.]|uniref:pilus assembly protein TadG-related protein n=1 Tax=Paraconexibacter sp. TaxID=2949640 RepID=UPI00356733C4